MVTDAWIAEKVDRALWDNNMLRSTDYPEIDVAVKDGVVSLRGHVISAANQRQAEDAARSIPGVRQVTSYLVSDDKIIWEVAVAVGRIKYVHGDQLFTGAHNGVVVLSGSMSSAATRSLAEQYAASIPQVRGVINAVRAPEVDAATEDQRFLQPAIGKPIYFSDNLIAKVQRVIINPNNRRVVAMLVRAQFSAAPYSAERPAERLVVIPIHFMRHLTKSSGFLKLYSAEAARYKDFDPADFTAPSEVWTPPYPYVRDDVLFPVESMKDAVHKQTRAELKSLFVGFPREQPAESIGIPV